MYSDRNGFQVPRLGFEASSLGLGGSCDATFEDTVSEVYANSERAYISLTCTLSVQKAHATMVPVKALKPDRWPLSSKEPLSAVTGITGSSAIDRILLVCISSLQVERCGCGLSHDADSSYEERFFLPGSEVRAIQEARRWATLE